MLATAGEEGAADLHREAMALAREEGDDVIYTAGSAAVRLSGAAVTIVNDGDSEIDLLRAGTAAVWNAGRPIYALEVDPGLYS